MRFNRFGWTVCHVECVQMSIEHSLYENNKYIDENRKLCANISCINWNVEACLCVCFDCTTLHVDLFFFFYIFCFSIEIEREWILRLSMVISCCAALRIFSFWLTFQFIKPRVEIYYGLWSMCSNACCFVVAKSGIKIEWPVIQHSHLLSSVAFCILQKTISYKR